MIPKFRLSQLKNLSRSKINAGASTAEYGLRALVLLVSTPIFYKALGAELFGIWILVNTIMGLSGLFKFGMGQATVKYVSQYRATGDTPALVRVIRTTLTLYLGLGVVGGLLIYLLAPWFVSSAFKIGEEQREIAKLCLMAAGLGYPVVLLQDALEAVYRGYERFDLLSVVNFSFVLVSNGVRIAMVLLGVALPWIVLATVAIMLAFCLIRMLHLRHKFGAHLNFLPAKDLSDQKEVFSYGLFAWLTSVLGIIRQRGDVLIISALLGPAALPPYTIGLRLLEQTHALLAKASQFLLPAFSRLHSQGDVEGLRRQYDKATSIITVLASAMIVPIFMFSGPILTFWISEEFSATATPILQVMALRFAVYPLSIVNAYIMQGVGEVKVMAAVLSVSTVLVFGAMLLLIPVYGLMGAALAQCIIFFFLLFNRAYVAKTIFGSVSLLHEFMNFLPVIILLILTTYVSLPEIRYLPELGLGVILTSIVSASLTWLFFKCNLFVPNDSSQLEE
jgi:O-antigen/teichoic acid export membrane protein